MSTNTCSELAVLLEKSLEDLKSHLGRRMGGNGLAFHRSTLEDISSIFCQQLQAAPVNFLQGRHSFPARKISGWRMELWQAALSYLNRVQFETGGLGPWLGAGRTPMAAFPEGGSVKTGVTR
jgi:hypothetical protein